MGSKHTDGDYAIVGCGRLGCTVASGLVASGRTVACIYDHSGAAARALADRLPGTGIARDLRSIAQDVQTIFVTVPDREIHKVATALDVTSQQGVVHCSGATDLRVLSTCATHGAEVACFHPLQSFPDTEGDKERLSNIAIGIEASGALEARLLHLVDDLESRTVRLEGVDRSAYHAAAVFVSNYLVALFSAATKAWSAAGLRAEDARTALGPLSAGTLDAIAAAPLRDALTGPVARGDIATVQAQLQTLASDPELATLYRMLAIELLSLGLPSSGAQQRQLLAALEQEQGFERKPPKS
ncbi:MAG: DUF2520 domain-containing protein [Myxococcales bacterium]|nr:DUF2520 domain-containing protein [Myxococcales bacterium]